MAKGIVDGTVKDRKRGQAILSALLEGARPGTVIRVSTRLVRVDKSGVKRHTKENGERGDGKDSKV